MPGPILCALPFDRDPFSRSYGVNLPSSLTVNLSSASVYSTQPPVSVYGTGSNRICLAGFLGSMITIAIRLLRRAPGTISFQHHGWICLPVIYLRDSTCYSVSTRMCHFSVATSLLLPVTESLPFIHRTRLRLILRSRLTLIRLALIRNPGSCGGRVSRPPYRYLYLHLLFQYLQHASQHAFCGLWNAPLPMCLYRHIPRLRHRTYARLLSMRDHSTSELLRTL